MSVAKVVTIVLGALWANVEALNLTSALGAIRESYTTNAICGKKYCVNPVFPGMEDLHRLQQAKWICSNLQKTAPSMGFCRNAITYDPALPMPSGGGTSVKELVQRQDNAASTMFYYHLTGLGLEAWDYKKPEYANDCVKSMWRMVCFTYFPRAEIGCQDGGFTNYIRPCRSSCENYIRTCGVECCDESVSCVFSHTKAVSATQTVTTQGYSPHDGPSSLCTGASRRSATPFGLGFWVLVLLAVAMSLQGCDYDIPVHTVGNWRAEPDYLITHEFIPPGASAKTAGLNSCSLSRLSQTLQCSGRGVCKLWDEDKLSNTLAFCECDRDWADPECRTRRKSQLVAYLLSMFAGFLGADQFYLGFVGLGFVKLFSFGGFGVWWVMDIIRIGSAPVYSSNFAVAADLPHYAFVLTAVMFSVGVGFTVAFYVTVINRADKRKSAMLLQSDEDARQKDSVKPFSDAYTTGRLRPVIEKPNGPPSFEDIFQQGGGGGGAYGSMGMGQMPQSMGMPQSMAPGMP